MSSRILPRASGLLAFAFVTAAPYLALAAPGEDIRDIRGPIAIPPWWRWPLAIAVAALAALAVVLVVRWWRARRSRAPSSVQRAEQALAKAEDLAGEGRAREWADLVAETLRSALAARLGVDVLPQTTGELSASPWATSTSPAGIDVVNVIALLDTCDLARFAKAPLDSKTLLAQTAIARDLIGSLFAPPPRAPAEAKLEPQTVPS